MTDTQTQLTAEYEQEIRAREAAATPGPWGREAASGPYFYENRPDGPTPVAGDVHLGCGAQALADREFIAHARRDVPALLSETDRLRVELDSERVRSRAWRANAENRAADSARLRKELEREKVLRSIAEGGHDHSRCGRALAPLADFLRARYRGDKSPEAEAKRRIVDHAAVYWECDSGYAEMRSVLCELAAGWADHPDYREEWRP